MELGDRVPTTAPRPHPQARAWEKSQGLGLLGLPGSSHSTPTVTGGAGSHRSCSLACITTRSHAWLIFLCSWP